MNATRILPELQASLVCEAIRQEIQGGFVLVGVVNVIRVPQLPVVTGRFYVFNRWIAGVGRFQDTTRLVSPDGSTELCKGSTQFELQDPAQHATNILAFANVQLKTAGTYYIEVTVDEVMKLRAPLTVILAPPPAGQPVPTAAVENQLG